MSLTSLKSLMSTASWPRRRSRHFGVLNGVRIGAQGAALSAALISALIAALSAALIAALSAALVWPLAAVAAPTHTVPDTLAQRVQACTICHGEQGRATRDGYFPRIAGKPAGYLHAQLLHFRDGRRHNATMTYLVEHLTDAYLLEIAQHFAALDLPYAPPPAIAATPAMRARGEQLARRGDPARDLPACAACHGERLTGVQPALPGLLGLPRDYLLAQFGNWQTGLRRAAAPDCMGEIARRMSPEDIGAVAAWLAAQPVTDARPAAALAAPLPVACGSLPAVAR
jgi:cytochrome c553